MTSRIAELSNDLHPAALPAPPRTRRKPARRASSPAAVEQPSAVARSAGLGVGLMLVLSAGLTGYANAQHSPVAWAGWLMGLAVPVIVLVLAKVCGEKWRAGQKPIARFAGSSGAAPLLLSVWHCSQSIAILTGSPVALAQPMAVAIDCGLVACEVALISEPRR
jgi:hypothetical protein